MDAIRLAGLTPTRDGYTIAPHLPFPYFSLRMPRIGIAAEQGRLRGYLRPEGSGPVRLTVQLPFGVSATRATAWIDGRRVRVARGVTTVSFSARGVRGRALDWAVTWAS